MSDTRAPIPARALWLEGRLAPGFRDEEAAAPRAGELRARALFSGLSHGTEMLVYRGEVPAEMPLDLPTFAGGFGFPVKYGYASVGRVIDVGEDVVGLAEGDAVFALHPHQSVFTIAAELAFRLPDGLDPLAGVFGANLETAVNVLLDTPLKLGETAAVFGQGTVGLLVTQLLVRAGARVVAIEPLPRRRAAALACGAREALSPGPGLADAVRALTSGRGADVAIEASGTAAGLQGALDSVADEGTVVAVSWYGSKPVGLELGGRFHRGRVRIRSSQVGSLDPTLGPRWTRARRTELVKELLPSLRLTELVSHRFAFEDAPSAYRLVNESPGEVLQVVLTYD